MADLLVRDLMVSTGGSLQLAAMPARDGDLTMLRRSTAAASEIRPGDLYWALQSSAEDGMRHVEEAFARGAAGAVISGRNVEPWPGKFSLRVHDVRAALWQASALARTRFQGRVIAIAGDEAVRAGRLVHRVLGGSLSGTAGYAIPSAHANALPSDHAALAILNAHPSHDYLVLGLAEQAEMNAVAERCFPHVCVVAGNCDQLDFLETLPEEGWAILPGDDARLRQAGQHYAASTRTIWYGRGAQNDLVASEVHSTNTGLRLAVDGTEIEHPMGEMADLPGILASIALGKILYISDLPVLAALGNVPVSRLAGYRAFAAAQHSHLSF